MTFVLAGEEPIDHMQRTILSQQRKGETKMHPLVHRIMDIHVSEEARHISFAQEYLEQVVPKMSPRQKKTLAVAYPMTMRLAADIIMKPSKEARGAMGIPEDIAKEVWWDSDFSRQFLSELFPRARGLADRLGLRDSKLGRAAWKRLGIDEAQ
jgi:hypothetical protein